jgi:1-acyl-sn-glycerol-3-phosphate acyltransferase
MPDMALPIHTRTKKRTRYSPAIQWLGRTLLRLLGWRLVGANPNVPKCVVACAPHTSNWDFPLTLMAAMALSVPGVFMIKDTVFWWPLGVLLRWLGGIPIDRRAPEGTVDQMVQVIKDSARINVIITPEGTRKNVEYWKLGFYRIALGANVPILFGIINYKEKWIGTADLFYPVGNLEEDWSRITEVFQRTVGVTPTYRPRNGSK